MVRWKYKQIKGFSWFWRQRKYTVERMIQDELKSLALLVSSAQSPLPFA